jgi:hypothetical protein
MTAILSPTRLLALLLLACLALAALGLAAPAIQQVTRELTIPQVNWTIHASLHEEASEITQCLKPENILQVWINSSGERLNCLVGLPDGTVGDAVLQYSCRRMIWIGVVAYQIGDGSLKQAMDVLRAKACTRVY